MGKDWLCFPFLYDYCDSLAWVNEHPAWGQDWSRWGSDWCDLGEEFATARAFDISFSHFAYLYYSYDAGRQNLGYDRTKTANRLTTSDYSRFGRFSHSLGSQTI